MVKDHKNFMGGIDQNDQIMTYYSCEPKTLRWYIFQIMLINFYSLFNKFANSKNNLYDFRLSISEYLLTPASNPQKQPIVYHLPEYLPTDLKGKSKRRRCKYCWVMQQIRKDSIYLVSAIFMLLISFINTLFFIVCIFA